MKAKFLLAMALPVVFAACTNEDEILNNNATTGVTGEKISSGMVLTADRNLPEATTRLNANGWEAGDKIGLGWISNSTSGISADQGTKLTDGVTDQNLYDNMLFTYGSANFTSEDDVYKGAYFAYYPYTRLGSIKELEISLNGTQKVADAEEAYFKGVLSVSAKDFISDADVNENDIVEKQFSLQQIANALVIKTKMGKKGDYTDAQIAGMKITGVTLNVGQDIFYSKIKLKPQNLPKAVYDEKTGAYDAKKTMEALNNTTTGALAAVDKGTASSSLSVAVETEATLATENNGFVLFSLPASGTIDPSQVSVVIRTVAGEATIEYTEDAITGSVAESNNKAIEKLVAILSTDGWKAADGKPYKFSEILSQRVGLDFQIDMDNFKAIYDDIKNAAEWNGAVKYLDTFLPGQKYAFTLTDDIEFTSDELITLPKAGLKEVKGNKTITFKSGVNVINQKIDVCNVDMTIAKDATLTVNESTATGKPALLTLGKLKKIVNKGTLNVNGEVAGASEAKDSEKAAIENGETAGDVKAVLNVGVNGKINSQDGKKFTICVKNYAGATVTVGYNSFVHYAGTAADNTNDNFKGVVKGIINGNDATAKTYYAYLIERMTAKPTDFVNQSGTSAAPVICNTIELQNITVTNGDKVSVGNDDLPWADANESVVENSTFDGINVVLNNATLDGKVGEMNYGTIVSKGASALKGRLEGGALTVEAGTLAVSQYTDAKGVATDSKITITTANLEVKKDAKLTVDKSSIATPAELTNAGTITVTGAQDHAGSIDATKITNDGAITATGGNASVTYANAQSYTQGKNGSISGNVGPKN